MGFEHKQRLTRLLIVSPHFPPSNAADMHRVRAMAPFLEEFGWRADVLCVHPESVHVPRDEWLCEKFTSSLSIHRAIPLALRWSKLPGFGGIDARATGALRKLGSEILSRNRTDLVYFSTTAFGVHVLGPYWKHRFDVPFVMDYQDPWVNDYYREHPAVTPPGGRLKYAIADRVSRYHEPRVLKHCLGITSVSPMYPVQLKRRYPSLANLPYKVLPFPGASRDFERAEQDGLSQPYFDPADGSRHWVYVGRGGDDMAFALTGFFTAMRTWREENPVEFASTRLHFIGTSYAAAGKGRKTVEPLAQQLGVGEIVSELTDRISYSEMLRCLIDADALIVPGSNDAAYTASKLYPYLLARKPLLAIFNRASSVVQVIDRVGGAQLATFDQKTPPHELGQAIYNRWFRGEQFAKDTTLDEIAFAPYTDRGSTQMLCNFF